MVVAAPRKALPWTALCRAGLVVVAYPLQAGLAPAPRRAVLAMALLRAGKLVVAAPPRARLATAWQRPRLVVVVWWAGPATAPRQAELAAALRRGAQQAVVPPRRARRARDPRRLRKAGPLKKSRPTGLAMAAAPCSAVQMGLLAATRGVALTPAPWRMWLAAPSPARGEPVVELPWEILFVASPRVEALVVDSLRVG